MANMGTVWDRTVEFLSDNVGSVTPIALLAIFVPTSISNSLQDLQADPMSALSLGLGLVSLLLGLAVLWGNVAITALVLDPALEGRASAAATRRFPAVVGLWLLLLALTLALTLPIMAILSLGGVDFATLTPETVPNVSAGAAGAAALYGLVLVLVAVAGRAQVTTRNFPAAFAGLVALVAPTMTGGASGDALAVLDVHVGRTRTTYAAEIEDIAAADQRRAAP